MVFLFRTTTVCRIFLPLLLLHPLSSTIAILPSLYFPLSSIGLVPSSSSHHASPYLLSPPSFSFTTLPLILSSPPPPSYPITLSSSFYPLLLLLSPLYPSLTFFPCKQALLAQYNQNYDLQALHLLHGAQWDEAHTVILDHLIADMIINGVFHKPWLPLSSSVRCTICTFLLSSDETQSLVEMLEQLSDHSAEIQNWTCGGSVSHPCLLPALFQAHSHGKRE